MFAFTLVLDRSLKKFMSRSSIHLVNVCSPMDFPVVQFSLRRIAYIEYVFSLNPHSSGYHLHKKSIFQRIRTSLFIKSCHYLQYHNSFTIYYSYKIDLNTIHYFQTKSNLFSAGRCLVMWLTCKFNSQTIILNTSLNR